MFMMILWLGLSSLKVVLIELMGLVWVRDVVMSSRRVVCFIGLV